MRKPRPDRGAAEGRIRRTCWNRNSTTFSRPLQSIRFHPVYRGPRLAGEVVDGMIEQIGRRAIAWSLARASTLNGAEAGSAFRSADHIRCRLGLSWGDLAVAGSSERSRPPQTQGGSNPHSPAPEPFEVHYDR